MRSLGGKVSYEGEVGGLGGSVRLENPPRGDYLHLVSDQ